MASQRIAEKAGRTAGEKTAGSAPGANLSQEAAPRSTGSPAGGGDNLDLLLDIPLEITIELGRTRMLINDLLKLGQGSIIELHKEAGDTLEILANNRLIAKGDVVVVNKKYGIRLTEVISPVERVEKLG